MLSDDTVRLHPNSMEGKEASVSIGFTSRPEDCSRPQPLLWTWTLQRQTVVIVVVLVASLSLVGLLSTVIALRVHLHLISTDLRLSESKAPTYDSIISNLTSTFKDKKYKFCDTASQPGSCVTNVVYIRWGLSICPDTAQLIYPGVTASGSSIINGGGSNHLCMTTKPDYLSPKPGKQGSRSYIFGAEYRTNGEDFAPLASLHGHDAPCAACLVPRRTTVLMVPGSKKCPDTGNWTREYFGYIMAAKKGFDRTSYICVDINAESTVGSKDTFQQGSLLFPVEGYCNTNAGGGIPCGPYIDGHELTCAVCTL